jgi:Cu(I)/Ag(I) efflux system protein CusF
MKAITMKSLAKAILAATLALSSASVVHGQSTQASASVAMSSGEVRKVDKSARKMTIKHGPLENIGMDAMTMVFRVQDPAMLDQVKPGDNIHFVAEKPNGQLTVTQLRKKD